MLRAIVLAALAALALAAPAAAQNQRQDYADACLKAIGPVPGFSCADGDEVPVTVDGIAVGPTAQMACDRPALLSNGAGSDGQCVPHSRILSLSAKTAQIAVMCRQKKIRPPGSADYDEIDVIAHNPASGATCWFQAKHGDGTPVGGASVPSPTSEGQGDFWGEPQRTVRDGCGACHDAGPFMYSPFVGQVWSVIPKDPFGPYFHVAPQLGFAAWPTDELAPRDNACIGCHRIGTGETCGQLTLWMTGRQIPPGSDSWAQRYPASHAMPPDFAQTLASWGVIYQRSVDEIRSCCEKPGQQACNKAAITKKTP